MQAVYSRRIEASYYYLAALVAFSSLKQVVSQADKTAYRCIRLSVGYNYDSTSIRRRFDSHSTSIRRPFDIESQSNRVESKLNRRSPNAVPLTLTSH